MFWDCLITWIIRTQDLIDNEKKIWSSCVPDIKAGSIVFQILRSVEPPYCVLGLSDNLDYQNSGLNSYLDAKGVPLFGGSPAVGDPRFLVS